MGQTRVDVDDTRRAAQHLRGAHQQRSTFVHRPRALLYFRRFFGTGVVGEGHF